VTDLTFRTAGADDIEALVTLVHAAYRDPDQPGWTTEAGILGGQRADVAMVADLLADPDVVVTVGGSGEEVVACGVLRHPPGTSLAGFGLFAVAPDRQSEGIGGMLLTHVERLAAERGATGLRLEVIHTRHELLGWYRRRDYHPTGETQPFPYGNDRFGVPRRPDLRFIILERHLDQP
jgi:ribosomal protein S18 acetylase RimI-like enzyme